MPRPEDAEGGEVFAAGVEGAVGEDEGGLEGGEVGVGVEGGLEDADGFGGGEGDVGVEEEEVFAFGVGEGEVVAAGEAEVGGGAEEGDAGGDVEGGLGGVVDDDDLGFGEVAEDGVEAPGQQLGVVPGDDDDGEARAHGFIITKGGAACAPPGERRTENGEQSARQARDG